MQSISKLVDSVMLKSSGETSMERAIIDTAIDNRLNVNQIQSLVHSLNKVRLWSGFNKEASPEVKPIAMASIINEIKGMRASTSQAKLVFDKDACDFITEKVSIFPITEEQTKEYNGKIEKELLHITDSIHNDKIASDIKNLISQRIAMNILLDKQDKELKMMVIARVHNKKMAAAVSYAVDSACKDEETKKKINDVVKEALPLHVDPQSPSLDSDEGINWSDQLPATIKYIAENYEKLGNMNERLAQLNGMYRK